MSSSADYRIVLCESRFLGIGPRRWWWRLESTVNGQVLATSETYNSWEKQQQTADRLSVATGIRQVQTSRQIVKR